MSKLFFKKSIVLFAIIFLGTSAFSQSIQRFAFSSGANSNGSSGSVFLQSNIGEIMASTYSTASNMFTQGFVQNDQFFLGVAAFDTDSKFIKTYPNPVGNDLNIEVAYKDISDFVVEVFDLVGNMQYVKIVKEESAEGIHYKVNFENLTSGIYFLKITSATNECNKTVKIVKV